MSEQLINPINLVSALRILINASSTPAGPSLETASRLTHHLELPTDWLHAVLSGWQQKASRRTSKSYRKTMTSQTPIRFMSIKLLPKIDLRKYGEPRRGNAICRLCGKCQMGAIGLGTRIAGKRLSHKRQDIGLRCDSRFLYVTMLFVKNVVISLFMITSKKE